jgi:hypothetical protein
MRHYISTDRDIICAAPIGIVGCSKQLKPECWTRTLRHSEHPQLSELFFLLFSLFLLFLLFSSLQFHSLATSALLSPPSHLTRALVAQHLPIIALIFACPVAKLSLARSPIPLKVFTSSWKYVNCKNEWQSKSLYTPPFLFPLHSGLDFTQLFF